MKKIKRIYFAMALLATTVLFTSCYKGFVLAYLSEMNGDDLIGTWEWELLLDNGVERELSDCEQMNTVQYRGNGEVVFSEYGGGDCSLSDTTVADFTLTGSTVETIYRDDTSHREVVSILELSVDHLKVMGDDQGESYIVEYRRVR